jgi:hypothetical protein
MSDRDDCSPVQGHIKWWTDRRGCFVYTVVIKSLESKEMTSGMKVRTIHRRRPTRPVLYQAGFDVRRVLEELDDGFSFVVSKGDGRPNNGKESFFDPSTVRTCPTAYSACKSPVGPEWSEPQATGWTSRSPMIPRESFHFGPDYRARAFPTIEQSRFTREGLRR